MKGDNIVREQIALIPKLPGCYIFKNIQGEIIYIGKSKSLRDRVKQYFYPSKKIKKADTSYSEHLYLNDNIDKNQRLAREIHQFSTITTESETDALILECQLVKKHKPRYNAQLKRTRQYPYLRIGIQDDYPSVSFSDCINDDGSMYFGSFYDADDVNEWIKLLGTIWKTPGCGKKDFYIESRPCLNHHLGKCLAPCGHMESAKKYREHIGELVRCLEGDFESTLQSLENEMTSASDEYNFEQAAKLRDQASVLKRLRKRQKSFCTQLENREVYLFFSAHNEERYSLFFINNGFAVNRADFFGTDKPSKTELEQFVFACKKNREFNEESKFLTDCLLDIRANKYFVPIVSDADMQEIIGELIIAYNEFQKNPD